MNRIRPFETVRTIDLGHEQLLVLDGRSGNHVRVLHGGLWLTEEGRRDDRFARPGDELLLTERGRAVLEGIGRTRIELLEPVRRGSLGLPEGLTATHVGETPIWVRSLACVVSLVLALGLPDLLARSFRQGGDSVVARPDASAATAQT